MIQKGNRGHKKACSQEAARHPQEWAKERNVEDPPQEVGNDPSTAWSGAMAPLRRVWKGYEQPPGPTRAADPGTPTRRTASRWPEQRTLRYTPSGEVRGPEALLKEPVHRRPMAGVLRG
jgi:hypothetical protein